MEQEFCPYCMTPVEPGGTCSQCGLTAGNYTPFPHHLPPGTLLKDRYLVGRVLGEGGFGITYIGCDLKLELKVAIKEYFPTDKVNRISEASLMVSSFSGMMGKHYEEGKQRFLKEARTMARMDKLPVIVSVKDFFEANNTAYIVMEFIEGVTFKELVEQKGGRIPAGELLHEIEPLFHALQAMHEKGLIHRDISPDNLMLERGSVRLLDFGCAREASSGDDTLSIVLKHGYAPVEQYMNKGQGPWTDVYALSATIYYCLTGQKPAQSMDRMVEDELILPRKLGVDLTVQQERALLYGMGVRPKRRFQTVREMHAALYEGVGVPGGVDDPDKLDKPDKPDNSDKISVLVDPPPPPPPPPHEPTFLEKLAAWLKTNRLLAMGGAAALALIVMLAVALPKLMGGSDSDETPDGPGNENTLVQNEQQTGDSESQEVDLEAMFQNARKTRSLPELRQLMRAENVEAVILPADTWFRIADAELVITKPLLVQEGAGWEGMQNITVTSGGYLRVEGEIHTEGLLRTVDGGKISVSSNGRMNAQTYWMENETDLSVEPGGYIEAWGSQYGSEDYGSYRYMVFHEEAVFGETALYVSTFENLKNATDTDRPIVIDTDMTITEQITHHQPLLIREGVTVTVNEQWQFCTDGAVLVNHGTLQGSVNLSDWDDDGQMDTPVLINYGTMDISFFTESPSGAIWLNLGEMTTASGQIQTGVFHNIGTLRHEGRDHAVHFDFCGESFINAGELIVTRGENSQEEPYFKTMMGYFANLGSIRVENGSRWVNFEKLCSVGDIVIGEGGTLINDGLIENYDESARFVEEEGGDLNGEGVIQYDPANPLQLNRDMSEYGEMRFLPFVWSGGDDKTFWINSEGMTEELLLNTLKRSQLYDVIVVDTPIVLTQDIVVETGLVFSWNTLTVDGGSITVAGENAFLIVDGGNDLGGSTLTLRDGATAVVGWVNCGGLDVSDSSTLLAKDGGPYVQGGTVTVRNAMVIAADGINLDSCDVLLDGGIRNYCWMDVINSNVIVGEDGWIHNEGNLNMEGSTLENNGYIGIHGWDWLYRQLPNTIINRGNLELQSSIEIHGSLTNYGTIRLHQDDNDGTLYVYGSLDNQGEILMAEDFMRVRGVDGGTVTGNKAVYDPDFWQ